MRREIGGWLEGPQLRRDQPPGVRIGLPAEGPGSVAGFGSRVFAYVVDGILANLLAGVPYFFGAHYTVDQRSVAVYLAFLLEEFVLVTLSGKTLGMHVARIRVVRVAGGERQSAPWVLARTVLLGLLFPALIWDRDQRGLHDRAAGTVVISDGRSAPAGPAARRSGVQQPGVRESGSPQSGVRPAGGKASRSPSRPAPPARNPGRRGR